jgi:hypothetical protein
MDNIELNTLIDEGILSERQLINVLRNRGYCLAVWSWEDVLLIAQEKGINVTESQARGISTFMNNKHEASQGITWTDVQVFLDEYLNNNN